MEIKYNDKNAINYTSRFWTKLSKAEQDEVVTKTIKELRQSIINNVVSVSFHNTEILFKCIDENDLKIDVTFDDLSGECLRGAYNPKTKQIVLDESLRGNGREAFEVIYHEFTHAVQDALSSHIKEYEKNTIEHQYLFRIKNQATHEKVKMRAFEMDFFGEAYISPSELSTLSPFGMKELISAFYKLQITERNAVSTGNAAGTHIDELDGKIKLIKLSKERNISLNKAVETIRNHYGIYGATSEEIYELVDTAMTNITTNRIPANDLEAEITYDIVELLYAQVEKDPEILKARASREARKMEKMTNSYFNPDGTKRRFIIHNQGLRFGKYEFINDFNKDNALKNEISAKVSENPLKNPDVAMYVITNWKQGIIPEIPDLDGLRVWYVLKEDSYKIRSKKKAEIESALWAGKTQKFIKADKERIKYEYYKEHPEFKKRPHRKEKNETEVYDFHETDVKPWIPASAPEKGNVKDFESKKNEDFER